MFHFPCINQDHNILITNKMHFIVYVLMMYFNYTFLTLKKYEQHQRAVTGEKLFTNKFVSIKLYTHWVQSTILGSLYSWELQHL